MTKKSCCSPNSKCASSGGCCSGRKKWILPALLAAVVAVLFATALLVESPEAMSGDETAPAATSDAAAPAPEAGDARLGVRAIGNPDAPVRIEEFSSLTCPHCAEFHKTILPKLKTDYIDTGKVYLIFRDYPLNPPAIDASMTARCLPSDTYESFVGMLFEQQEKWAFNEQQPPQQALKQYAKLAGLSDEAFDSCLNDAAFKAAIVASAKDIGGKYDIKSTPTFVLNDGAKKIEGTLSYENYTSAIDALLAAAGQKK